MSAVHIIFICFIPFTSTMNSTNWPAPNVWVFIAQLVEHCSANAEAMVSNPVEAPKTFFGLTTVMIASSFQIFLSNKKLFELSYSSRTNLIIVSELIIFIYVYCTPCFPFKSKTTLFTLKQAIKSS